jgi:hypothetical protein
MTITMLNATMQANAQALPEETNRRGFLRGVLAAGSVGATLALPTVAVADVARSHPDAELFALIERTRTACSVSDEANVAAEDIWERMEPSFPHALTWAETDAPHWHGVRPGHWIPDRDINFLRHWLKLDKKPDPTVAGIMLVYPTLEFVERAREIVQTKDEYEAAEQAAREHPDVLGAEARLETLLERWRELALRVATTQAKTTEGLIAKLAFVAPAYEDNDLKGTYDGILASAALDAQAMAKEARS